MIRAKVYHLLLQCAMPLASWYEYFKVRSIRITVDRCYKPLCLLRRCESCLLAKTALGSTIGINGRFPPKMTGGNSLLEAGVSCLLESAQQLTSLGNFKWHKQRHRRMPYFVPNEVARPFSLASTGNAGKPPITGSSRCGP